MENLTKCEDCVHQPVCRLKEGYVCNVGELTRYPAEEQTIVQVKCKHYVMNKLFRPSGIARVMETKESGDFRDRESFPK